MGVPRNAWKPGAVWKSKRTVNPLIATICGPALNRKDSWKQVRIAFTEERRKDVVGDYSHKHMVEYFDFAGYFQEISIAKTELVFGEMGYGASRAADKNADVVAIDGLDLINLTNKEII